MCEQRCELHKLWFDVGIKRYTTHYRERQPHGSCGLMQESKDIQLKDFCKKIIEGCGLMQESKDIQLLRDSPRRLGGCGLMQESKDIQQLRGYYEKKEVVV